MSTLSFKATDDFKKKLVLLAQLKGINVSAYIKLLLTQAMKDELSRVTENGMTAGEELEILWSALFEKPIGPFSNAEDFMRSLKK